MAARRTAARNPGAAERVGVLLVHGIGEQRRFQHLDSEARHLIAAIMADGRQPGGVARGASVALNDCDDAAFGAEARTWRGDGGAPIVATVRRNDGRLVELHLHEVWWADLDDRYTWRSALSFWAWGLGMWTTRGHASSTLPGTGMFMRPPARRGGFSVSAWDRLRLFSVGVVFALAMPTIELARTLLKRLFGLTLPGSGLLVDYVGDVKLYQQAAWLTGDRPGEYGQRPRVAIRRRFVTALVRAALADYDRWYVVAHSLGTVVAFNGLMESEQALPNYLSHELWQQAKPRFGSAVTAVQPSQVMWPPRPPWLDPTDGIDRKTLFAGLRGLLTYGSPLEKFAGLWPAIVVLNTDEAVFRRDFEWLNVRDPCDPVAGEVPSFAPVAGGPRAAEIAYRAAGVHLLSHIGYLSHDEKDAGRLVDAVVRWLVSGGAFACPADRPDRWLARDGLFRHGAALVRRRALLYVGWAVAAVLVGALFYGLARSVGLADLVRDTILPILCGLVADWAGDRAGAAMDWLSDAWDAALAFLAATALGALACIAAAAAVVAVVGGLRRLLTRAGGPPPAPAPPPE